MIIYLILKPFANALSPVSDITCEGITLTSFLLQPIFYDNVETCYTHYLHSSQVVSL